MPLSSQPEHNEIQGDDLLFKNFLHFLGSNWRFIGLTTVVLSAVTITLSLLQPKQYQKHVALSVQPVAVSLSSAPTPQSLPGLDISQITSLSMMILQRELPGPISSVPKYKTAPPPQGDLFLTSSKQIDLTLTSSNLTAITNADSKIITELETGYQKSLKETVEANVTRIEQDIRRCQEVLAQLENRIGQMQNSLPGTASNPRVLGLEEQRSSYVARITALEFDKQHLEKAEKNLPQFTSQFISVKIVSETEVQQTRSPLKICVLAIIASFMVAVFATLIRDQVVHLKNEMSKPNHDRG